MSRPTWVVWWSLHLLCSALLCPTPLPLAPLSSPPLSYPILRSAPPYSQRRHADKLARAGGSLGGSYLTDNVQFGSFCLGTLLVAVAILLAVFPWARSFAKDA